MPKPIIWQAGSAIYNLIHGTKWKHQYARISFPILVKWAEQERNDPESTAAEHTYGELAVAVGQPNHWHSIDKALGIIGEAIKELNEVHPGVVPATVPPIELFVWTKGMLRPGDDAFYFIGLSKQQVRNTDEEILRALATLHRSKITAFRYWRTVLALLGLKPLTLDLPPADTITAKPGFGGRGGGERPEHERMKCYLAEHYRLLGIAGPCTAKLEKILLSADRLDLFLEYQSEPRTLCVEVKSRISDDDDLLRGVFQCVKYRALLEAQEIYNEATQNTWVRRSSEVILATERPLPKPIAKLAAELRVATKVVRVPDGYIGAKQANETMELAAV